MSEENVEEKVVLPHHEQKSLCTTRLPYRQGRKLTAVKVYTVNNESNHLLIFGVPSLNLRQELKLLFIKFGKLSQFVISKEHPAEAFTETYHAVFENIQSARVAKRMIDTTNFYGGSLHVCYAPELEEIDETRKKILKRRQDVLYRLKNLEKDTGKAPIVPKVIIPTEKVVTENKKLFMGEINVIGVGREIKDVSKHKRKLHEKQDIIEKQFQPKKVKKDSKKLESIITCSNINKTNIDNEIQLIDFTSTEKETITNIDDGLNYNKFGNEIVRKVPQKPVNIIKFNIFNKKL